MRILVIWILALLAVLGIGLTGGYYLALYIQEEYAALLAGAIIFGVLTWLGSASDIMGLLREWYKDQVSAKRRASLDIKYVTWKDSDKHPLLISNEWQVLTLQITNSGGGEVAQECSAMISIKGMVDYSMDALNWLYKTQLKGRFIHGQFTPEQITSIIQHAYAKNWKENIRAGESSYLDILFTRKNMKSIYVLDADHTKLEYGQVYDIGITIIANDLKPKRVSFQVEIPSHDVIQITNFSVA